MASNFEILVEAKLNPTVSYNNIKIELDKIAEKINREGGLKVDVNISESRIGKLLQQMDEVQTRINKSLNISVDNSNATTSTNKITEAFKGAETVVENLQRRITEYTNHLGQTVRQIEEINAETKQWGISETVVIDNLQKARQEQEKLTKAQLDAKIKTENSLYDQKLQEQESFYNKIIDHLYTINGIKIKLLTADENQAKELQKQLILEESTIKAMNGRKAVDGMGNQQLEITLLKEKGLLAQQLAIAESKVADAEIRQNQIIQKQLIMLQERLKNAQQSYQSSTGVKDAKNLAELEDRYKSINEAIKGYLNSSENLTQQNVMDMRLLINELDRTSKGFKDLEKTVEKGFNFTQYKNVTNEMVRIKSSQDGYNKSLIEGHKLISANVQETQQYYKITQQLQDGNWIKNIGVYVNKANGEMYQFNKTIKNNLVDTITLRKALETAVTRMMQWAVAGGLVFNTLRFFTDGVKYVVELNKALTEISIVTGKSQRDVAELGVGYQQLAKAMSLTTVEVAKGAVEFYRQGLTQAQVMDRLKETTIYSKISNLEFAESAKIITATVNSMGVSAKKATDTFAYMG